MTTTEPTNGTALAVREFSDKQIRTRLEAASKPGFGMDKATRDQLNMVYLLAKHYDVDPAIDITLFQGRPFFTIDGRVRLMKRHPQYRGYHVRPLSKDEKDAWGFRPDEIVVECSIRTKDWGEITARGKVTPDEFRRQPVAAAYPQEMAEKRAIARASRMAFGQDVPDEDEVGYIIEERNDPERVALQAARYTEIMGTEEDAYHLGAMPAEPAAQDEVAMVTSRKHPLWAAFNAAKAQAEAEGLDVPALDLPQSEESLRTSTAELVEAVEAKRSAL